MRVSIKAVAAAEVVLFLIAFLVQPRVKIEALLRAFPEITDASLFLFIPSFLGFVFLYSRAVDKINQKNDPWDFKDQLNLLAENCYIFIFITLISLGWRFPGDFFTSFGIYDKTTDPVYRTMTTLFFFNCFGFFWFAALRSFVVVLSLMDRYKAYAEALDSVEKRTAGTQKHKI